jgi:hypothetical protein
MIREFVHSKKRLTAARDKGDAMNGLDKKEMWKHFVKEEAVVSLWLSFFTGVFVAICLAARVKTIGFGQYAVYAGAVAAIAALWRGAIAGFRYNTGLRPVGVLAGLIVGALTAAFVFPGLLTARLACVRQKEFTFFLILFCVCLTANILIRVSDRGSKKIRPPK